MTSEVAAVREGCILRGPFFDEPVRVEVVCQEADGTWSLGVVGLRTERFRNVTLSVDQLALIEVSDRTPTFTGDGNRVELGLQAYALGLAYEFDPYFGLSMSRVDPLPHQLSAVYHHLLPAHRVRFLLADDAGAGKTIMAGLLLRELKLRGLIERVLIVCPANLAFQWQREMKEKFSEKLVVLKGGDIREQFGVNQWLEHKQVITSLDLAKRNDILPGLRQVHWDLVIVDEAHRMSWSPPARKTARYALGELLRDSADHLLLLTATPHKGDPENFSLFLQLLDRDVYADVKSIREAMERRFAPFYLRRTKEAMVFFPERQPDGTWAARPIFTKRIPRTVDFKIDGPEDALYRAITAFVKRQSALAAANEEDPRARAVGFLMSLYQRRLSSSTHAVRCSLESRARRLDEGLKRAHELANQAPPVLPDLEDLEEMDDAERERLERIVEAISLARNAEQIRQEIEELRELAVQAVEVENAQCEAKLAKLRDVLQEEGFFDSPDKRLLLFTEFKDTLDYLVKRLRDWGFRVGFIHGGMKPGSRDEAGTRLHAEEQFWEGAIQILVATEAAGEGINLQCCHVLFNYDIPWNPNRLEQRMGRIHRYGQKHDCLIFNFVATNTIEGRVLARLLEKLQEIRDALDDDAVFNVVGEILPAAQVERVLRDYYAGKMGAEDLEDRLLHNVDEAQFRAICENALEGLATRSINLKMLAERQARAQERRVVPETIARFILKAADAAQLQVRVVTQHPHCFEPGRIPTSLKRHDQAPDWRLPAIAARYPRCSTDRDTAALHNLEWVTPGHPLFEALRREAWDRAQLDLGSGACFYSLAHAAPVRIDLVRARAVDGLGHVIHERFFAVELSAVQEPRLCDPQVLGNFTPAPLPAAIPDVASQPVPPSWLQQHALLPFLEEVRAERVTEIDRVASHIESSLTELLLKTDEEIGGAAADVEQGIQGAEGRQAQAETRHAELLARRDRRRRELEQQRALTLQAVERLTSVLVLPHPERETPDVRRLRPDAETEATAMRVVIEHERALGRQVLDVCVQDLGYDVTSLDLTSGELRLIEVKGLAGPTGTILLTPNERRAAEDRRDCYWLYIVTHCADAPQLQPPVRDPARHPWHEVTKVQHYWLQVDALTATMRVSDADPEFGCGG